MKKYNNLFTPLTVRSMTMKNRIAMTPMGTNFGGEGGDFTEEHMQYYEQRAMGGVGLIIVENACVDFPLGSNGTTQIRLTEDRFIPALYELTERIHKHGACAAIQINHSGASAVPSRIGGLTPVSASNIPSKTGGAIPRPLTKEEIVEISEKYAQAARRAQMAGFDAVEIHGGHSYLLCQFLSPIYNNRTDEFGGSLENRARFARLVIDKVREAVGPFFPIMLRISADEFVKGGNTLEDTLKTLEYLNEEVDIFNVSSALNDSIQFQIDAMHLEDGWRAYMAEAVKKKFNKPTITTGNIRSPKIADEILGLEKADIIGMGRGLIAEPNWVNKVMAGKEETLRKCISCNIGCADNRIAKNRGIRCTINPDVIYEDSYKNKKVKKAINVVVIGGGTAGLEAACTAAEVGCTTFLLEERPYLGGLAREIAKLPEKDRINDFPDYLIDRANKLKNLIVFTNTKANTEVVANLKPDVIVNATGSTPLLPPIKGLLENIDKENGKVNSIFGLMKDVNRFDFEGKKVAVIGGGAVGLDVVELFATRGAEVSIVERLPMLGRDLDIVTKIGMLSMVKENNVNVLTSTSLLEVKENSFVVEKDAVQEELEFDYGFVCLGMRNYAPILGELQEYFLGTDVEIINIGDSVRARRIIDGIKEGRNIVTTLEKIGAFN
ncbi:NAD(P)/FAD-dependent oxidoreductase [uncultured Clostridium sp.]|uniref:NAD(P)/FAD-dependent oxidoreductase n=1 Tax=uncultured Clostridium sp. TaxID=59620 RepID=UPI0025F6AD98|nr:NAD(P)/FAD-dependent oxidoreductase [uncultured Clostridium sp.]